MRRTRVLALVALVAGAAAAAWAYSRSAAAASLAAGRLGALVGAPARVERLGLGLTGTTLAGLTIDEPGGAGVLLTADAATADVSAAGLAWGAAPRAVTLRGAHATLRFDPAGNLLTKLPAAAAGGPTPAVRVEGGTLTLRQEGRPDRTFAGIDAELRPEGRQMVLVGTVRDPAWGAWALAGSLDPAAAAAELNLANPDLEANPALLETTPFVPAVVWQEVRPAGRTSCEVTVRVTADAVSYRVALGPRADVVELPSLGLTPTGVTGAVVVEDGVVRLDGLAGTAAGGTAAVDGSFDYASDVPAFDLRVQADGMGVQKLPAGWGLPKQLGGKLGGRAKVRVELTDRGVRLGGEGDGVITDATLAGFPADPIKLRLRAAGGGLKFETQTPAAALPAAAAALVALAAPAAPAGGPTYLDINLGLRDVDVAEFLKRTGVAVPISVAGKVSFRVKASVPLDAPRDVTKYRAVGTVESPSLTLEGVALTGVTAKLAYRDGVLTLDELSGRVAGDPAAGEPRDGGAFRGSASLGVAPAGDLTAKLQLDRVPTAQFFRLAPAAVADAGGLVSGSLDLTAPTGRLRDPAAWTAAADVTSDRLRAFGWAAETVRADARLKDGVATLSKLAARVEGTPVTGSAEVRLAAGYPFSARVNVPGADLAALGRLAPAVRPPVAVTGTLDVDAAVKGTLDPPSAADVTGTVRATRLTIERFGVRDLALRVEGGGDVVRVRDLRASLYGGTVTGTADLPLRPAAAGAVNVTLAGVDAAGLTRDLPGFPVKLEGDVGGTVKATLPPAGRGERPVTAAVDLAAPRLEVQGIPAEGLTGTINYRDGSAAYKLEGRALGGTFDVNGELPLRPKAPSGEGRLRVTGVRLARLWPDLGLHKRLGPLGGSLDADVAFRHGGDGAPEGEGRVFVRRPVWGTAVLAPILQGTVLLEGRRVRVTGISASPGGGVLRADLGLAFGREVSGTLRLRLDRVPPAVAFAPFPDLGKYVDAPVSAFLRVAYGRRVTGRGFVGLGRGHVVRIAVNDARLPLTFEYVPATGSGVVNVRRATANAARGRAYGDLEFRPGEAGRLAGNVVFDGLELSGVAPSVTRAGYAGGRLDGRFDFGGTRVRSVNDVTGRLNARLKQTQALQLPVLSAVAPFLTGRATTRFEDGHVRAVLGNGIWRVDHLSLVSDFARLYADGTVTVGGRLDLDVTAVIGQLTIDPRWLRLARISIPLTGPLPVGLVVEASQYLSNRTVRLTVRGTVSSPVVRVNAAALLRDEALRFLLNQSPVPLPNALYPGR